MVRHGLGSGGEALPRYGWRRVLVVWVECTRRGLNLGFRAVSVPRSVLASQHHHALLQDSRGTCGVVFQL